MIVSPSLSYVILLHHQLLTASAYLRYRSRMQCNARACKTALAHFWAHLAFHCWMPFIDCVASLTPLAGRRRTHLVRTARPPERAHCRLSRDGDPGMHGLCRYRLRCGCAHAESRYTRPRRHHRATFPAPGSAPMKKWCLNPAAHSLETPVPTRNGRYRNASLPPVQRCRSHARRPTSSL